MPVLGLEPSCLLTMRDEFTLLPGPATAALAEQALLLEEFLWREHGAADWICRCGRTAGGGRWCTVTATRRRLARWTR